MEVVEVKKTKKRVVKGGSKTKSKSKGVSAKQSKARARFKKAIARAKKIRKSHPNKKWSDCVKEAFKKE